tara:strand:+ start:79 stop:600 length:522 start_codon:yes stop_codon:yes gene_type:complete
MNLHKNISFVIFVLFFIILSIGLFTDTKKIRSPLINKKIPEIILPDLISQNLISNDLLPNETFLLNVWASWCQACITEHEIIKKLSSDGIKIIGINYKDERDDAMGWLSIYGNPYLFSYSDSNGKLGLELGVYGVPETFIVDKFGIIKDKIVGPVNEEIVTKRIKPLIDENND